MDFGGRIIPAYWAEVQALSTGQLQVARYSTGNLLMKCGPGSIEVNSLAGDGNTAKVEKPRGEICG
jgi:hypothetical protein